MGRVARAAALVLASLVAMELALDLAGLVAGERLEQGRDAAVLLATADVAVYGDSTPYGYHAGTSFPAELARATGLRVVNRSRPALNSTQVADLMERELRDGSPPVLVVMAGVNDAWNLADVDPDLLGPLGAWRRWLPEPRLLRLFRIWTKAGSADEPVEGPKPRRGDWSRREETDRVLGREGVARITRRSIERILAVARRDGAEVVFVGYQAPGWNGSADAVGELLAAEQPDRFVEMRSAFAGRDADLLLDDAFHPNDEGQRLIARRLRDALGRRGLLGRRSDGTAPARVD
ncbi:MAG: SGNH/GDSL hydrolase family protein [Alphaproteobacteria bacterium]